MQLLRTITVLPVRDIVVACAWYERALGLRTIYLHEGASEEEPTNYAVMIQDDVQIHLILDEPPPYSGTWTQAGTGYLYLRVRNVVSLHTEILERGIVLERPIEEASWGAVGFELRDPDGNLIRIENEAPSMAEG